jgi:4-hydroxybenzoate polyprenyltransferase
MIDTAGIGTWARALRVHQWLKNLLILVPLASSHRFTDLPLLRLAILATVIFSMCASSVYLLNDLHDRADDRVHPKKRFRPIAAGQISAGAATAMLVSLLLVALALSFTCMPMGFTAALGVYYALTVAYSFALKTRMVFDVVALAALYALRIIAGAAAVGIRLGFWLLAMAMFMFLSLALVKRYAELFQLPATGSEGKAKGRGYFRSDLEMIAALGAASGYMSVMVLALYINDPRTTILYRSPELIWLACPLLLTWISRMWMMTHRGFMNDDPLVFAVRDRVSQVLGVCIAIVFWLAT